MGVNVGQNLKGYELVRGKYGIMTRRFRIKESSGVSLRVWKVKGGIKRKEMIDFSRSCIA